MGKSVVEGSGGRDSFTEARRVCGRCRKAGGLEGGASQVRVPDTLGTGARPTKT